MSGIVNVGSSGSFSASSQITAFDASFVAVTTSLDQILAADSNCYKLLIFNPSNSTGNVIFTFVDSGDTPTDNQCFILIPGMGWIEEGSFTAAGKAIHAKASTATSVLIWRWTK